LEVSTSVQAGDKIFCKICRVFLCNKHSTVLAHLQSAHHRKARQATDVQLEEDQSLQAAINASQPLPQPGLPQATQLFRVKFLKMLLVAGIPLNRIPPLRQFVEQYAFKLTSAPHLADYLPIIQRYFNTCLAAALNDQFVNLIFDGRASFDEAYAIVARWLDQDLNIHTKLVSIGLFAEFLNAPALGHVILKAMAAPIFGNSRVVSATHDSASVNKAAVQFVKVMERHLIDLACLAHLCDLLGSKVLTPELDNFMKSYHLLFSHSIKTRASFKAFFHESQVAFSVVRWWSSYEQMKQIFRALQSPTRLTPSLAFSTSLR